MTQPEFLKKPLKEMTESEWESLCDGCGLCCQMSLQDEDTGQIALSNVACRYLCLNTHSCTDYANRQTNVPDCIKATPDNIMGFDWLPPSCGYRLVAHGHPLPEWHHLVCGDKQRVHTHGPSMLGELISEDEADWDEVSGSPSEED